MEGWSSKGSPQRWMVVWACISNRDELTGSMRVPDATIGRAYWMEGIVCYLGSGGLILGMVIQNEGLSK